MRLQYLIGMTKTNNADHLLTMFIYPKTQFADGELRIMGWKDGRPEARRKSNSMIDFYCL